MLLTPEPPLVTTPTVEDPDGRPVLGLRLHLRSDHTLVAVTGDVDVAVERRLATTGEQLARRGLPVVLDASGVSFIDCAGLGALLTLAPPGGHLVIKRPSACVQFLLDLVSRLEPCQDDAPPLLVDARLATSS